MTAYEWDCPNCGEHISTNTLPPPFTDDFRDRNEQAFRDHILGAGDRSHTCDDLCSDAILDRMVGKSPNNEYPLQPQYDAEAAR